MAKYCTNCGKEIDQEAVVCPSCGRSIEPAIRNNDSDSKWWSVLGFFISPVVALILWLCLRETQPKKARRIGIGALIGLIVSIVSSIIYAIIIVVEVMMAGEAVGAFTLLSNLALL